MKYRSTVTLGGETLKYPNLEAEMKRSGVTCSEMAKQIQVSRGTLSAWMNGTNSAFPIIKAKQVRDQFFEGMSLDYLFDSAPIVTDERRSAAVSG